MTSITPPLPVTAASVAPTSALGAMVIDLPAALARLELAMTLVGTVLGRDGRGLTWIKTDQGAVRLRLQAQLPAGQVVNMTLQPSATGSASATVTPLPALGSSAENTTRPPLAPAAARIAAPASLPAAERAASQPPIRLAIVVAPPQPAPVAAAAAPGAQAAPAQAGAAGTAAGLAVGSASPSTPAAPAAAGLSTAPAAPAATPAAATQASPAVAVQAGAPPAAAAAGAVVIATAAPASAPQPTPTASALPPATPAPPAAAPTDAAAPRLGPAGSTALWPTVSSLAARTAPPAPIPPPGSAAGAVPPPTATPLPPAPSLSSAPTPPPVAAAAPSLVPLLAGVATAAVPPGPAAALAAAAEANALAPSAPAPLPGHVRTEASPPPPGERMAATPAPVPPDGPSPRPAAPLPAERLGLAAGTTLAVRVVAQAPPPPPGTTTPPAVISAPAADRPQVVAVVVGRDGHGHALLESPFGRLSLDLDPAPAEGTRLLLELTGRNAERAGVAGRTDAFAAKPGDDHASIKALDRAFEEVRRAAPDTAPATLESTLPRPGPRLAQQLLGFLAAAESGDARLLLGSLADRLSEAGRADLVDQIGRQLAELKPRPGQEGDWRFTLLPLVDGGELDPVRLYSRRGGRSEEGEQGGDRRFIVEVDLTELGRVQIDGFFRRPRIDLIVRTQARLGATAESDLALLFDQAVAAAGLVGELGFKVVASFPGPRGDARLLPAAGVIA